MIQNETEPFCKSKLQKETIIHIKYIVLCILYGVVSNAYSDQTVTYVTKFHTRRM